MADDILLDADAFDELTAGAAVGGLSASFGGSSGGGGPSGDSGDRGRGARGRKRAISNDEVRRRAMARQRPVVPEPEETPEPEAEPERLLQTRPEVMQEAVDRQRNAETAHRLAQEAEARVLRRLRMQQNNRLFIRFQ